MIDPRRCAIISRHLEEITMDKKAAILSRLKEGMTGRAIAAELSISPQRVSQIAIELGVSPKKDNLSAAVELVQKVGPFFSWADLAKKSGMSVYVARKAATSIGLEPETNPAQKPKAAGKTYGNWTVLDWGKAPDALLCLCSCGREASVLRWNLGRTTGCVKCGQIGRGGLPIVDSDGNAYNSMRALAQALGKSISFTQKQVIGRKPIDGKLYKIVE
jgi:hypothetical protein